MGDLQREKERGFDFEYLGDVPQKKIEIGNKYQTPGFGLTAQLFCMTARRVIEQFGSERGMPILRAAVEDFGRERGRSIAGRVSGLGLELSFKNWLIYSDIDSSANFETIPSIDEGDLVVRVNNCTFYNAARQWGLTDIAHIYCKHVDYAILAGYNPDIKLILHERQATGADHCVFRYIMRQTNK